MITEPNRAAFVSHYSRALVTSWSSDAFANRLATDPVTALAEVGIDVPAGATVVLTRPRTRSDDPGAGGVDRQYELYRAGLTTGHFEFYFPDAPTIDTTELAMSELNGVAAGGIWDPYCCSCCPSCCSATGTP